MSHRSPARAGLALAKKWPNVTACPMDEQTQKMPPTEIRYHEAATTPRSPLRGGARFDSGPEKPD
jgi:hypothetical protein